MRAPALRCATAAACGAACSTPAASVQSTLFHLCTVLTLLLVLADAQFVESAEQLKRLRLAS